jgi:UDP-N-acetylmuramyl pentapeptide phosphotransferase/UDP-N-acetylglucosamine-1-phosphate transferase
MQDSLTPTTLVVLPLLAGGATALALWALLASGAAQRLALDAPNARSLHVVPTPRVGGLVLVPVALLVAAVVAPLPVWLAAATLLLVAVGAVDDRRGAPVAVRLAVQLVAAGVALWPHLGTLGLPLALVIGIALVWAMNAYNFMDGSDGLAAGMALIGFTACAIAAASAGQGSLVALSLALAGAAAGFLWFNFAPARVFLGDAGSVPLGFLAGAVGLLGALADAWAWWFVPVVFAPVLADATTTLLARGLSGKRVWQAHREHAYQRLVQAGFSHKQVAVGGYLLMLASAAVALVADSTHAPTAIAIAWLAALVVTVLIIRSRFPAQ